MRIVQKNPAVRWKALWKNIHSLRVAGSIISEWYAAIHDIITTRQRLAAIKLATDSVCILRGDIDTIAHRLTKCKYSPIIWQWTKGAIAAILRVCHTIIPEEWAWCPMYTLWPPQRHTATWILAHFVYHRLRVHHGQSLNDYRTYLRRARWEMYQCSIWKCTVGSYLDVL
jgi:hypothetical protein